nr:UPF0454 protein like [Ipomoea batatas]
MPKTSLLLKSLWWFQLVVALQFSSSVIAIRKDVSLQDNYICRTTVQGRYMIADDKGQVCDALSVDPQSRCCRGKGEQFSCHGCNLLSQCCNSYEFCVACCLNPSRTPKELALKVKIAKPITADIVHYSAWCWEKGKGNHVIWIQKYLSCKGGCLASIGADQPAEVVDDAPEDMV